MGGQGKCREDLPGRGLCGHAVPLCTGLGAPWGTATRQREPGSSKPPPGAARGAWPARPPAATFRLSSCGPGCWWRRLAVRSGAVSPTVNPALWFESSTMSPLSLRREGLLFVSWQRGDHEGDLLEGGRGKVAGAPGEGRPDSGRSRNRALICERSPPRRDRASPVSPGALSQAQTLPPLLSPAAHAHGCHGRVPDRRCDPDWGGRLWLVLQLLGTASHCQ